MAKTEKELLNNNKSLKLRYFGNVMRHPHDNIQSNISNIDENYCDDIDGLPTACPSTLEGVNGLAVAISYVLVFFVGFLGNTVVIYVVWTMEKHRTSTDVYLMHLAVADLLFSLTLPFWAIYVNKSNWIFGSFLCKLLSGVQEASFYCCVFLLACISIDRYVAIVKATQFLSQQRYVVRIVCALVWLGAIALSIPVVVQREALLIQSYDNITQCYDNFTANTTDALRILRHILGFFLPLTFMLVCYGWTVGTLFRSRNSQKHKAMRVILCVVLAFIICWLPNNVAELLDTLMRGKLIEDTCKHQDNLEVIMYVSQVLAFTHCAINPILYAFVGKKFRNHLLQLLSKKGLVNTDTLVRYRLGSIYNSGSSRQTYVTM
ncbi:C-X-C chemokine receptor type 2 [Trichomycterus rosablanca]|uniref:C-X-C chemokine receptor type 2 n=1 Tax=Trichomycterus rosablanca TaxID=2290929 RepID=UPI002F351B83